MYQINGGYMLSGELKLESEVEVSDKELTSITGDLIKENQALKAALKDVMAAVLELSNSLGPTLDAINNHAKVIMPLVNQTKEEGEPC